MTSEPGWMLDKAGYRDVSDVAKIKAVCRRGPLRGRVFARHDMTEWPQTGATGGVTCAMLLGRDAAPSRASETLWHRLFAQFLVRLLNKPIRTGEGT